jgi:hypothetical protein
MGRMETGETTTTDPAMAKPGVPLPHPPLKKAPTAPVWRAADACRSRRSRMKDMCVMVDSVPVDGLASAL